MRALVDLRGVALTYPGPPEVPALLACDLRIHRGEYVTIVGPSGSGKSTFLNVVGLLDRPTSGSYVLDGVDTGALDEAERTALRAHHIGFVFQSFNLIMQRSAEENVMLAQLYRGTSHAERRAIAVDALDRVGLTHRRAATPTTMSGGERQRTAIARALAAAPTLLLCDEPTGNLDSVTAESVLRLVDELRQDGLTVLVITHDAAVAARGDRSIQVHDGLLAELT